MKAAQTHRIVVLSLTLIALALAGLWMSLLRQDTPWYRNTNMNMHVMVDALALNAGVPPKPNPQPAIPLKLMLAANYRVLHAMDVLPVATLDAFARHDDPLRTIPSLIRVGLAQQAFLVLLVILASGGMVYSITRELDAACLTVILLSGSTGLLFHGALMRPELLCAALGTVGALWCTWLATSARGQQGRQLWLFSAGIVIGVAMLESPAGLILLVPCFLLLWCHFNRTGSRPAGDRLDWSCLLPMIAGGAMLWIMHEAGQNHDKLNASTVLFLRIFAVATSLLPLLNFASGRAGRWQTSIRRCSRDIAMISGGILCAVFLLYSVLRWMLSSAGATHYLAGLLNLMVHPADYLTPLGSKDNIISGILKLLRESPILFLGGTALAIIVSYTRAAPRHLRLIVPLLAGTGIFSLYLMSRGYFTDQYSIFAQVPLLISCALGFSAMRRSWSPPDADPGSHWLSAPVLTTAFILGLTVYLKLQPKHNFFQDDASLPINEFTLTFIYDHDAHPDRYVQIMQDHYQSRGDFRKHLMRYIESPPASR